MRSARNLLAGLLLAGQTLTAGAAEPPPTGDAAGRPAIHAFVQAFIRPGPEGYLARWSRAYCPKVVGLPPAAAAGMLDALRAAAAATGHLAEAPAGCAGDVLVIFTANGDGLVRALLARQPALLIDQYTAKQQELIDSGAPVRWWYATAAISTLPANGPDIRQAYTNEGSHLQNRRYAEIRRVIIVIDTAKTASIPGIALAHAVAMLALVPIARPPAWPAEPTTALAALAPQSARVPALTGLTRLDRAVLAGLYRMRNDRPPDQQLLALELAANEALDQR